MKEYIEREAAIAEFSNAGSAFVYGDHYRAIVSRLNAIPAADVRPVVRAAWKRIDYKPCGHDYECSSCEWKNDMPTHFCPNCGADMRDKEG